MTDLVKKISYAISVAWDDWHSNAADTRPWDEVQQEVIRDVLAFEQEKNDD